MKNKNVRLVHVLPLLTFLSTGHIKFVTLRENKSKSSCDRMHILILKDLKYCSWEVKPFPVT